MATTPDKHDTSKDKPAATKAEAPEGGAKTAPIPGNVVVATSKEHKGPIVGIVHSVLEDGRIYIAVGITTDEVGTGKLADGIVEAYAMPEDIIYTLKPPAPPAEKAPQKT